MLLPLVCQRCDADFEWPRWKKYCPTCKRAGPRPHPNVGRELERADNVTRFVGVDGEGLNRPDGAHEYVMLSVGDRTLSRGGRQLTLAEILDHLWESFQEDTGAAYVGFFLGYDFDQWIKLMPEEVARSLLTTAGIAARTSQVKSRLNPFPDPVVWEGWELDLMAGRRWRQRPHVCVQSKHNNRCRNRTCGATYGTQQRTRATPPTPIPDGPDQGPDRQDAGPGVGRCQPLPDPPGGLPTGPGRNPWRTGEPTPWLYLCDTGSYWQTSFLNVIHPGGWGDHPPCTDREYELVAEGKAGRGDVTDYGDTSGLAEMARYNVLENDILSRVTERLNGGFMNPHIPIKIQRAEWYGPGRAAQIWMDSVSKRQAKGATILNADVYASVPRSFVMAARESYYGGWFEQFAHGHVGDVSEYDINSAYPYIIAQLPCLHHGRWTSGMGEPPEVDFPTSSPEALTLVYVEVFGSSWIGTMPHRTLTGNIMRPHHTRGWHWLAEVEAAQRAGLVDRRQIILWERYVPCGCPPPFDPDDTGIGRMYGLRLEVGKNSPQGKAFKLVYNSAYGKTAQSVGSPKYANPIYASLITSGTRVMILDAVATHPGGAEAVTMVATDGVYFTTPHPTLELDPTRLGGWDGAEKRNLTQFLPGVYWDDSTRELVARGATPKMKSRGVSARSVAAKIDQLDRLWTDFRAGRLTEWPSLELDVPFLFTSARLALHRGKWSQAGMVSTNTTRRVDSNPRTKRFPDPLVDREGRVRTRAYSEPPGPLDSQPYTKPFGQPDPTGAEYTENGTDPRQEWMDLINGATTR